MEEFKLIVTTWLITGVFTAFLLVGGELPGCDIDRNTGWDTQLIQGTLGCVFEQFQPEYFHPFDDGTGKPTSPKIWTIIALLWSLWLTSTLLAWPIYPLLGMWILFPGFRLRCRLLFAKQQLLHEFYESLKPDDPNQAKAP